MIYLVHLALAMAMMQQSEMVCHDAVITAITLKGTDDGDHQPVRICELAKAEEPVDVPAIEITVPAPHPCNLRGASSTDCVTGPEQQMTCADKTRILEHDEQTPAKFWCRRVQP